MGCCCSSCRCCRGDDAMRESCGNITFPTVVTPQGQMTRTNRTGHICRNPATYFTVPLCQEHRQALRTSIALESRNIEGHPNWGHEGRTCLRAERCRIPRCSRPFHCHASLCSDHFHQLSELTEVSIGLRSRYADIPAEVRSARTSSTELEGESSPPVSGIDSRERSRVPELEEGIASQSRTDFENPKLPPAKKAVAYVNDDGHDDAPPPYKIAASASASSPASNPQKRVKRSSP